MISPIYADQKKVHLIRGDKVTDRELQDIRAHPAEDVKVLPGRQIQVPESFW